MSPITVRGVGIEAKGDYLLATFTLSETPSQAWIGFFGERATGSLLGIATATFRRNRPPSVWTAPPALKSGVEVQRPG
jgi:hypothetical protein